MNAIKMILGLSLLLSFSAYAELSVEQKYDYTDLSFTQKVIQASKQQAAYTTDELIQTIADHYAYYGLGDDGVDCSTKVFNLEISKEEGSSLAFSFDSQQDYAANGACFNWPVRCNVVMSFDERTTIDCQDL